MRSRSFTVAIVFAVLCLGGAVGSYAMARSLRTEAKWLMARGDAQAQEYAATFDGAAAEKQLSTFEQRRVVLERAQRWQLLQMLLVLAAVMSGFSSYVLFLFRRLREQLVDANDPSLHGIDLHGGPASGPGDHSKAIAAI